MWNSCTFRNTEMQQSSAVTFLVRSNGHRHQLFCLAFTLQIHVCTRILYDLSYFRFQLHHIALRLAVLQNCRQINCTHPKIIFFSVTPHVQTTESYRAPLSSTAISYHKPPFRLRNTPLCKTVTEIHHGYRVVTVLCKLRTEAEQTVFRRVGNVAKSDY